MKGKATIYYLTLIGVLTFLHTHSASAQNNIIMQGFYWNTIPGDLTDVNNGGIWWDTIATVAPQLKNAGFNVLWTPPAQKGFAGKYDMGYGISDYYDYGQYNQFGTVRTRHGNLMQLQNAITSLHNNNIKVMADLVLNHRAGAASEQLEDCDIPGDGRGRELQYTKFTPASGRIAMDSSHFHPTQIHCDLNSEYHNRSFFEDICYFNHIDSVLNPLAANNGWYFGPHNLGAAGDSLVVVGRNMIDTMGFDMVRLDAVKHIEPGFLAPFLVELKNGTQPFAVGELFDGNVNTLRSYHNDVENFISTYGTGSKNANMAVFDFALRYALRDMCNSGGSYDMSNLSNAGLIFNASPLAAEDVVTFVENHDVDRIGFREVACPGGILKIGNTCLELYTDSGHDPITSNKYMAYAYIMGAEGNPTVFWKDWFWYGLDDEIKWLIALRKQFANGGSTPMSLLNPSGGTFTTADYFIMRRSGTSGGVSDGALIGLNDNTSSNQETFVNTPFTNKYLKDYSDGFLFVTRQAFGDTRASIPTANRDYSWWSVTGLYPKPDGTAASHFTMDATPGGCPHFVTLRVGDAINFIVNGAPIQAGDEVAIKNAAGKVTGIGRIGQGFKWDGTHDMLIEVLGSPSTNGMANNEIFRLFVYDASANTEIEAAVVQFASTSTAFTFSPDRPNTPNRNGNYSTFSISTTATNAYSCGAISRITYFNTANVQTQQVCGMDDASNAAYDGMTNPWTSGDNGGTNFGAWTLSTTNASNAGHFVGNSNNNGDGNGGINTADRALGMYANNGAVANAVRPFVTTLIPGTIFSLQMDNGFIEAGGSVGFGLQNASGENILEFYFRNGQPNYKYNDFNGEQDTGLGFTDDGLTIQITLLTATTYQLSVTRNGGGSFTTTGTLKNPAGGQTVSQFRLFNANAGSGGQPDAFFNNFSVCYPPTIIINEVDYDQGATDNAEFVELKNVSSSIINLDNYTLELLNSAGTVYQSIDLPNVNLSANDYYVICANGNNTPNCDLDITPDTDWLLDGAPAGMRVRLGNLTVDALSYEGDTPNATEGTGTGLTDDGTAARTGISRLADGNDTNVNATDFSLACVTPGDANVNTLACPSVSFDLVSSSVGEPFPGTTTLLISVSVSNYLGSPISVSISAMGSGSNPAESPQDYILNTSSLVFNQNGLQFIQVTIQAEGSGDEEEDEFFTLTLSVTSANADLGANAMHTVTIVDNVVLPIELLDFSANPTEEGVHLKWITASEKNNAYFSVQRSRDGQRWSEIKQIKGQGNSVVAQPYEYLDRQPFNGTNYYRLQQFDFDGQSSFSPIRLVEVPTKTILAKLYPNPAKDNIQLNIENAGNMNYTIKIYDILGREITPVFNQIYTGKTYDISTSAWNSGTYFLRISNEAGQVLQVLTFQKQ